MRVASLAGDPYLDWLTEEYFSGFCNQAYDQAIQYLEGTCSPYIEKVVVIPAVQVGVDETNLVPYGTTAAGGVVKQYPLKQLVKPRVVDFKTPGSPSSHYKPVKEFSILPDSVQQVTPATYDIRVRGDFKPAPLLKDDDLVEIHPNGGFALAFSIMALIGMERPNGGWVQNFGSQAQDAWDQIAADLIRQGQHLTFRIGSPNRSGNRGSGWALQGAMGWEWRGYGLYLKLI